MCTRTPILLFRFYSLISLAVWQTYTLNTDYTLIKISNICHPILLLLPIPLLGRREGSLSTPGGRNRACFCSTGSGFRGTDRFSKLPYLRMKLGHWPKFQKLHVYFLFLNYPRVPHFTLFCFMAGQWPFPRFHKEHLEKFGPKRTITVGGVAF